MPKKRTGEPQQKFTCPYKKECISATVLLRCFVIVRGFCHQVIFFVCGASLCTLLTSLEEESFIDLTDLFSDGGSPCVA